METINCLDQAVVKKACAKAAFEQEKGLSTRIAAWFVDLDGMFEEACKFGVAGNYRAVYAYKLEFEKVLDLVSKIPLDRPKGHSGKTGLDDYKSNLTELLKAWVNAAYQHYLWGEDWLGKHELVVQTKAAYDAFQAERREEFIREAMDVMPGDVQQAC